MTTSARTTAAPESIANYRAAPMFSVSQGKLAVMSVCTMGIYEWYWFLKQWDGERKREREDISPVWRALLAPFYAFSLFGRIQRLTAKLGVTAKWPVLSLTVAYLVLTFAWSLPLGLFSNVSAVSFIPLLFVQRSVNEVNQTVAPELSRNGKYSPGEIVLAVLGVGLRVLVYRMMQQLDELMSILQSMR